ncbi:AraC family transcriptional regulator [Alkalicoccus urumqiensis]|uniref:AraC family transcriptional regulator n=1 Tax=Alkalicoccus urumqiensis TaxID=1548213 RepID=A0A2P6MLI6_ALKUR|nr:AraC family transcriptional regulator [Alkalicoccus urumqiensis]PRO67145.1 AraC family transcriptional regulator [Alkalicoccus urumqiensis]
MDQIQAWNEAVRYIEAHLTEEIDLKEAARRAGSSEFHFKRMFSFLAGVPVSEYIRRRRMSRAAEELMGGKLRVLDAAVKYQYQSPDAFTRAFRQVHGMTPSEAAAGEKSLQLYPPVSVRIHMTGGTSMNYRIVDKEAFALAGIKKRVPIQFEGENPHITDMWASLSKDDLRALKELSNTEPGGIVQASTNFSEGRMEEKGKLDHYIGAAVEGEVPDRWETLSVPASTWAVFTAEGDFPDELQKTWGNIYAEWFPAVRYEQREGPEILWMDWREGEKAPASCEIWIPVLAKEGGTSK